MMDGRVFHALLSLLRDGPPTALLGVGKELKFFYKLICMAALGESGMSTSLAAGRHSAHQQDRRGRGL